VFFIGTLIVGDPAYKMLAMFSENGGFQLWHICLCTVVYAYLFNVLLCIPLGLLWRVLESKVLFFYHFLWFILPAYGVAFEGTKT
jgi:hypothetical protein